MYLSKQMNALQRATAYLLTALRYVRDHDIRRVVKRGMMEFYRSPLAGLLLRVLPTAVKQRVKAWLLVDPTRYETSRGTGGSLKVSLVVPVYNHAAFLPRCLESALVQNYPHLEVIVVDDASPDPQVRSVLANYADDSRLKIFHNQHNQGISRTQNRGIAESSGDIVAFLDCDDFLMPDAVSQALEGWRDDSVYLHTNQILVDGNNHEVRRISYEHLPRQDYFAENLRAMFASHFKMIRREAIARVGMFDPSYDGAQDYDMLMRLAFHHHSDGFVYVPRFVYNHRISDDQETQRHPEQQQQHTHRIREEACLRRDIQQGRFGNFVSFIMLSYGRHEQTLEALQSLQDTVLIPHEVILFDNGSDRTTTDFLRKEIPSRFPRVKLFFHPVNLGPAQGRRVALGHAQGPYVVVFDNDEIAMPGWIEEMLVQAERSSDIAAVGSRVFFPDNTLQFSGGAVAYQDEEMVELIRLDQGRSRFDPATAVFRELDWVPIGATLFKVDPAPFLHDGYPNTFEDAAVSFQLRKRGYRLVNAPGSLVRHENFIFREQISMRNAYLRARYHRHNMMRSMATFYRETGLIIYDHYIWKENMLGTLSRESLRRRLRGLAGA